MLKRCDSIDARSVSTSLARCGKPIANPPEPRRLASGDFLCPPTPVSCLLIPVEYIYTGPNDTFDERRAFPFFHLKRSLATDIVQPTPLLKRSPLPSGPCPNDFDHNEWVGLHARKVQKVIPVPSSAAVPIHGREIAHSLHLELELRHARLAGADVEEVFELVFGLDGGGWRGGEALRADGGLGGRFCDFVDGCWKGVGGWEWLGLG